MLYTRMGIVIRELSNLLISKSNKLYSERFNRSVSGSAEFWMHPRQDGE